MILHDNEIFYFEKSAISSSGKGEENKNSCFQKYSESFWCVICYMTIFFQHYYIFSHFLPTY